MKFVIQIDHPACFECGGWTEYVTAEADSVEALYCEFVDGIAAFAERKKTHTENLRRAYADMIDSRHGVDQAASFAGARGISASARAEFGLLGTGLSAYH